MILRHTLAALVLRAAAGPQPAAASEEHHVFDASRAAGEEHFPRWRLVSQYAVALGYSARTLSRATRSAAGVSAKRPYWPTSQAQRRRAADQLGCAFLPGVQRG